MAGEDGGNPRVLVGVVPDGDADASSGVLACGDDVAIVDGLLGERSIGSWSGGSDVELSVGDVNVEGNEVVDIGGQGGGAAD